MIITLTSSKLTFSLIDCTSRTWPWSRLHLFAGFLLQNQQFAFSSVVSCVCVINQKQFLFLIFKKKKRVPFPSMAQALVSTIMDQLGSLIASEFQDWLGSLFASEFTSIVNEKAVNYRHKVWFIFILPLKF